jgi:hypothetical protein
MASGHGTIADTDPWWSLMSFAQESIALSLQDKDIRC